jgi:hypothetical protein
MRILGAIAAVCLSLVLSWAPSVSRAEDSKLKDATRQVEGGAKTVGSGIEETAKGAGKTVEEGAKTAGEKLKEAGKAAEPQAKTAWEQVRAGAVSFGQGVKSFFTTLVGK